MRQCTVTFLLLSLFALLGCGEKAGPPPVPISGTVFLDGQPLTQGFLYFKTIESGNLERFDISNGGFQGNAQVGLRRVEIYANRPRLVEIDGSKVEVQENVIDASYNQESTLTAQVTAEGPNQFRFDVRKK